jgi:formyl-CoA transferase
MSDKALPSGPLSRIRVLDMSQFILGPVATQIMGDMGADIIKVESPEGDANRYIGPRQYEGMAALFLGMNRNKRSIVLDLHRPEALEALLQMAEKCDVFLHSMRPDSAKRLGISYEAMRQRNPRLIYASAPGYRSDGPKHNDPAYDDVIQGESGIAGINMLAYGEPRYFPTVIADKFCGHVLATHISMALLEREHSGLGQCVEVPMFESMLAFNMIEHMWTAQLDDPNGTIGYPRALMPERRPFKTLDGYICLMATTDQQYENLFKAFDRSDLIGDPRFKSVTVRSQRFAELYGLIGEELAKQINETWKERLKIAKIPHASARMLSDLLKDPYLVETKFFQTLEHPTAGKMHTPSIPARYSRTPGQLRMPPPTLGEHTATILREFGFTDDLVHQLSK